MRKNFMWRRDCLEYQKDIHNAYDNVCNGYNNAKCKECPYYIVDIRTSEQNLNESIME